MGLDRGGGGSGGGYGAYKRHKLWVHELPFSPLKTEWRMQSPNLHQFGIDPPSGLSSIGTNPGLKIPSVASKRVHVRKKRVLIGCKHDSFWRHRFEVWSKRPLSIWFARIFRVKDNFPMQVCCFWAKTMHERCEKINVSETRWSVWGDSLRQRLSNVWLQNTSGLPPY